MQHASPPASHPAEIAPKKPAEPTAEAPSLLADLAALGAEIESATAGNASLDARIHFGFQVAARRATDIAAILIEHGITWPTVEAVVDDQIPAFTTSLDAALEGEDISFVVRSAKRVRWGAMQKARCGKEILAWAATEPLARRLAALRAYCVDLEKSGTASVSTPSAALPTRGNPVERPSSDKDWEVLF